MSAFILFEISSQPELPVVFTNSLNNDKKKVQKDSSQKRDSFITDCKNPSPRSVRSQT